MYKVSSGVLILTVVFRGKTGTFISKRSFQCLTGGVEKRKRTAGKPAAWRCGLHKTTTISASRGIKTLTAARIEPRVVKPTSVRLRRSDAAEAVWISGRS